MRFTDGLWQDRNGFKLHRAHTMWRYEIDSKTIRVLVPCTEIRHMGDTTYGPLLHFEFYSPREDMIAVRLYHFIGEVAKGPEFELDRTNPEVAIEDGGDDISMTSGRLKAVIQKKGLFRFAFYYDGELITGSNERGPAYVTDVDYEADRLCDYNGRRRPEHYMSETYIRNMLSLEAGEYIYGLGERFTPFVKNGQSVDIWNRDGGSCSDQAYKNIPFYISSKGYGVFVNTPARVGFEVGSINVRNVEFSVQGEALEYIVIGGGAPKAVISNYTALTGRPSLPPAWTFGLWLSSSWKPDSSDKITMEFIDGMLERDIPLSVFHFDARWMDDFNCCDFVWSKRFGDAREMLRKIHDKGVRTCVWINPYVSQESRLFAEGQSNGYFIKNKDGGVYQTDCWMSGMAIVDFTNPDAAKWYADRLGEIVDMGVDCIKTDFGERIPTDVVYFDGSDPAKMHNYYTYIYNKTIFEMLENKRGKGEACLFGRSATAGSQKFPVSWGGDNDSSYISMAETLRGGLSFNQSGFAFWAHDISGFENKATPDLYKRWSAFGLLSSHSRLHGQDSYRVPWCFDDEASKVLAYFTKLKCSLMPYLYSEAVNAVKTGVPMLRAMMMEFPGDPGCLTLDRQYMLGGNLLVAPIFNDASTVEFYVPQGGVWIDYLSGERFEGGRWYKRGYDYFGIPLLARPGSVIAAGATDTSPVYDYADGVTFRIFEPIEHEKVQCAVYDCQGKEAVIAEMSLENSVLSFAVSDTSKAWSMELAGVKAVKSVEGGAVKVGKRGVVIRPESGRREISVHL